MLNTRKNKHLPILSILFLFFLSRVLSQLMQYIYPVDFLPYFEAWQSGALPYEALLTCQVIIICWCVYVINTFRKNLITPSKSKAILLLGFGFMYLCFMLFRLMAGFTFAKEGSWLNNPLPSLFHIVLSLFVICHGHFHYYYSRRTI